MINYVHHPLINKQFYICRCAADLVQTDNTHIVVSMHNREIFFLSGDESMVNECEEKRTGLVIASNLCRTNLDDDQFFTEENK